MMSTADILELLLVGLAGKIDLRPEDKKALSDWVEERAAHRQGHVLIERPTTKWAVLPAIGKVQGTTRELLRVKGDGLEHAKGHLVAIGPHERLEYSLRWVARVLDATPDPVEGHWFEMDRIPVGVCDGDYVFLVREES